MDWTYVWIGGAALLGYFFFNLVRARNQLVKQCKCDIEAVLNSEENKIKGKYD